MSARHPETLGPWIRCRRGALQDSGCLLAILFVVILPGLAHKRRSACDQKPPVSGAFICLQSALRLLL